MSLAYAPSGRTRHRLNVSRFGKPTLVLQVEIHCTGYEITDAYGSSVDRDDYYWRDATVEDITMGDDCVD